ncbi:hypothetical protein BGZ61DRAFT_527325 [Ilyonectria robusta]|uniref:uncharacterized protein n=1 Tax=Ilyonectria robusta TaxID=1079257 RepID=UPI001E8E1229|nr:uncharacterized protein BGZ61DRAFT_527325 [Ilyonectria robusta]KAH8736368.1 hypothetical protein BGZ61DRAFT_527325 [Ilyonectria robusta]
MPKRPRQSDNRAESGKRRKVDRVQCPFRVYAREHGLDHPEDHCKDGQTFKGNEKLNEHLDRYHSLRYWCLGCKNRFRFNSRNDLAVLKSEHVKRCTKQPQREHEEEWARYVVMSSEQYSRWSNKQWKWNMVEVTRLEGETMPRFSWRRIYKCLFPETTEFPNPCCPTDVEPMPTQPLSLLPGPRDNSDLETNHTDWFQQQANCLDPFGPTFSSDGTGPLQPSVQDPRRRVWLV